MLELVEHNGFHLVTFADPKNASTPLMGWVVKAAFASPRPPVVKKAPVVPKCGAGSVLAFSFSDKSDSHARCFKSCEEDKECRRGLCECAWP